MSRHLWVHLAKNPPGALQLRKWNPYAFNEECWTQVLPQSNTDVLDLVRSSTHMTGQCHYAADRMCWVCNTAPVKPKSYIVVSFTQLGMNFLKALQHPQPCLET
jgi:hypothetical protein